MIMQCSCCKNSLDTSKFEEVPTFCPVCGAVLIENGTTRSSEFCHSCGKNLPIGAAFCSYCGMNAPTRQDKKEKAFTAPTVKTNRAAKKLYEEWMQYADLSPQNVAELTGEEVAGSAFASEEDDAPVYNAAPRNYSTGARIGADTPEKVGTTISALLRNHPFLISLAVNALLLILVILLIFVF